MDKIVVFINPREQTKYKAFFALDTVYLEPKKDAVLATTVKVYQFWAMKNFKYVVNILGGGILNGLRGC